MIGIISRQYDVNLKEDVWDIENDCYMKLEKVLMEAKSGNDPLFLAVEKRCWKI